MKSGRNPWVAVAVLVMASALAGSLAFALEPPAPGELEKYRQDGSLAERLAFAKSLGNHRTAPGLAISARQRLENLAAGNPEGLYAPPTGWRGMPTKGTVRVLALCIAFSDLPNTTPVADVESNLFGNGLYAPPYDSLRNFYKRSSYEQLEITGSVLGWYTTSYPRSQVPQSDSGRENLIKAALNSYDAQGFDFSPFDNDGDGAIDYLVVIWTGPDNGWGNFWWGYMTGFGDSDFRVDGKKLSTYSWQWEGRPSPGRFSPRVVIHETGHALGLPDFYDYDEGIGPMGGVGGMDQMDANWGDHNCWSKFMLDWLTPTALTSGSESFSFRPSGTSKDCLLIMPGIEAGSCFDEFFMVQRRKPNTGADSSSYPADGLVIWHVDAHLDPDGYDFLSDNSYTPHKLLRLMEADGYEEIERYAAQADAGDYYRAGAAFGPNTFPSSARYDSTPSGVAVSGISAGAETIDFTASIEDVGTLPAVSAMAKKGNPFRIEVAGVNFASGIKVFINDTEWPAVTPGGATGLTIDGGKTLKKAVPRRVMTKFTFQNPDGGQCTLNWQWP